MRRIQQRTQIRGENIEAIEMQRALGKGEKPSIWAGVNIGDREGVVRGKAA